MSRKKDPVLIAMVCSKTEDLRLAVEVLTGQRVQLIKFDFNTGEGKLRIGAERKDILCLFDAFSFRLGGVEGEWYSIRFDGPGKIRVIGGVDNNPLRRSDHCMWWVGRSASDRWQEPYTQ